MPMDGGRSSNSFQSEISVIGSLLIDPDVLPDIDSILTTADFESDLCREAWSAALRLRDNGKPIDSLLIRDEMQKSVKDDCSIFLAGCVETTPTTANVIEYCKLVKSDANKRRLKRLSSAISDGVYTFTDWHDIAASARQEIDDMASSDCEDVIDSKSMADSWVEYYQKVKKNPDFAFCRTGYADLDKKLGGGMYRSGMYIIGARPGMGKTTLGINIAENIATRGKTVLFVSLEMSKTQIMAKRMARDAGISYTGIMSGRLSPQAEKEAMTAVDILSERPFFLVDKSKVTVVDIGRVARRTKGVAAIVVDYLGLIRPVEESTGKPRYEQMTDISADLKALAKILEIPIVVLCQLNRENAKDSDKRPQLQHLRDSGAIEQDADAVVLLHRPEYYSKEKLNDGYVPPEQEDIELIVAKNRHGETGMVKMQWRGVTGEIREMDNTHTNTNIPF